MTTTDVSPTPEAAEWVPFSSRYGLVKEPWGRMHWTARHADHGGVLFDCCPPDPRKVCACPGNFGNRQCCEVATAEDLLCDACREHCWAIDSAKVYHRLIDLYLNASTQSIPRLVTGTSRVPNRVPVPPHEVEVEVEMEKEVEVDPPTDRDRAAS